MVLDLETLKLWALRAVVRHVRLARQLGGHGSNLPTRIIVSSWRSPPPNSPTHQLRNLESGKMGGMEENGGKRGG